MRYFFLLVLCMLSSVSFTQQLSYNYSDEIDLRSQDDYQGLLKADSTGFLIHIYEHSGRGIIDMPGRNLILEKYDTSFQQVFSYEYGEAGMVTLELVPMQDYLAWFVLERVKSYTYSCSMIPISMDGKEGKKQFLFETKIEKYKQVPETYITLSPDREQASFVAVFDHNDKKDPTEIFTAVVNNQGSLVWDKFTTLSGVQKQYRISDFQITNEGDIYFIAKYYKDKSAKDKVKGRNKKEKAGYSMLLYKIVNGKTGVDKARIDLDGQFVNDASLKIDRQNHIICTGTTSLKHKGNINGIFVSQFTPTLTLKQSDYKAFNFQELISLSKADADVNLKKEKNIGLDRSYDLCEVFTRSDGSVVMTMEQNYIYRQNDSFDNFGGGFGTGIDPYNRQAHFLRSNDLLTINVSAEGLIGDIILTGKKQEELLYRGFGFARMNENKAREESFYLSHTTMLYKNDLYFLYNDHHKNIDLDNNRRTYRASGTKNLRSALVGADGLPEVSNLFAVEDHDLLISPTRCQQVSDNTFFFSTLDQRRQGLGLRIGTITFND